MKTVAIVSLLLLLGCTTPKERIPDLTLIQGHGKKMIIYQMMTHLFGNQNATNKPYGTIEENGIGKFSDINERALAGIKELGVTHVWYTGALEHALLTDYTQNGIPLDDADVVKGRAGSPFVIKDYYDVNPDLANDVKNRLNEFEQLIDRTHAHDMKVIIDFVPNHVARGYKSDAMPSGAQDLGEGDDLTAAFNPSNNFYYLPGQSFQPPVEYNSLANNSFPTKDKKYEENPAKVTGNDQFTATPGINDWFETVKLNYGVDIQNGNKNYFEPIPNTWIKMKDILVFWVNKKVDGFLCDRAEKVPVEFWHWAIPQVKAVNPKVIFISEIYTPSQFRNYRDQGKFDFLYDKQLYDSLRLLTNKKSSTAHIHGVQQSLNGINRNRLHFLENHEEQRIASPGFANDAWKAIPAMVISALIDQGPVMIYFGQEVGEPGKGASGYSSDDGRTTIYDYWGVPEHQKWMDAGKFDGGLLGDDQKALRQFYGDILTFASTNKAITAGAYFDLTNINISLGNIKDNVHAFARVHDQEKLIILSSFSDTPVRVKVKLSDEVIQAFQLDPESDYIGHDMLRSSVDVGIDKSRIFEVDILPYSSFIFKIK